MEYFANVTYRTENLNIISTNYIIKITYCRYVFKKVNCRNRLLHTIITTIIHLIGDII